MTQPRISPIQHHGPFLGLNDTVSSRELPPAFSTVAHNVLLHEGRIRPRAPWRQIGATLPSGHRVLSIFHWHVRERDRQPLVFVKSSNHGSNLGAGKLWQIDTAGATGQDPTAQDLVQGMSPWPAQFLVVGKTLYVIDGGEKMARVTLDPIVGTRLGILPPTRATAQYDPNIDKSRMAGGNVAFGWDFPDDIDSSKWLGTSLNGVQATLVGNFSYAVTFRDPKNGRESNPVYSETAVFPNNQFVKIRMNEKSIGGSSNRAPADAGIGEFRVYRRNNSPQVSFYRLVADWRTTGKGTPFGDGDNFQPDPFNDSQTFFDNLADEDILVSNVNQGPFAPSRNGIPPAARCAAFYNDRMFYGPVDQPGKVFYSETGQPDHVDGGAFLDVTGDQSDDINGMLAVGSQLFIGKARGIHIHSGFIIAETNDSRAHGVLASELAKSSHLLFKTKSDIGPMTGFGNNFVLAGQPGSIHFGTDAGLFSFDGNSSRNLSAALIEKAWRDFIQRGSGFHTQARLTFAVDPHKRILYACNGRAGSVVGVPILAYHYTSGAWTTVSERDRPEELSDISCVATSLGDKPLDSEIPTFDLRPASLMVGFGNRKVEVSSESEDADIAATPWVYETGDLAVEPTLRKHFFLVKVMLKRTNRFWGDLPAVSVGYRLNGGTLISRKTLNLATDNPVRVVALQREAHDLRLVFQRSNQWIKGWSPDVGIEGFALSVELAGQT